VHNKVIHIQLCILREAVDLILQLQDVGSQRLLQVYRVINDSITTVPETPTIAPGVPCNKRLDYHHT